MRAAFAGGALSPQPAASALTRLIAHNQARPAAKTWQPSRYNLRMNDPDLGLSHHSTHCGCSSGQLFEGVFRGCARGLATIPGSMVRPLALSGGSASGCSRRSDTVCSGPVVRLFRAHVPSEGQQSQASAVEEEGRQGGDTSVSGKCWTCRFSRCWSGRGRCARRGWDGGASRARRLGLRVISRCAGALRGAVGARIFPPAPPASLGMPQMTANARVSRRQ